MDIIVSVIIPIFNTETYLREALDSVFSQTLKQIEVICVDDDSKDSSVEILQSYRNEHSNMVILGTGVNQGQAKARNIGLDSAKGKYVYFMDSDDVLTNTTALEKMYNRAERDVVDGLVFRADLILELNERNFSGGYRSDIMGDIDEGIYSGCEFIMKMMDKHGFPAVVWRQFWKRDYLVSKKLSFIPETSPHEDILFSFMAFLQADRISYYPISLYSYRIREGASTSGRFSKRQMIAYTRCYYEAMRFLHAGIIPTDLYPYVSRYLHIFSNTIISNVIRMIKDNIHIDFQTDFGEDGFFVYNIIMQLYPQIDRIFNEYEYIELKNSSSIVIYGAGHAGETVSRLLKDFGIFKYVFAVSDGEQIKQIDGHNTYHISELGNLLSESIIIPAIRNKDMRNEICNDIKDKVGQMIVLY